MSEWKNFVIHFINPATGRCKCGKRKDAHIKALTTTTNGKFCKEAEL